MYNPAFPPKLVQAYSTGAMVNPSVGMLLLYHTRKHRVGGRSK